MVNHDLEKKLYDYEVYDAWQYILNTVISIQTANYCKKSIEFLIQHIEDAHNNWNEKLCAMHSDSSDRIKILTFGENDLVGENIEHFGQTISPQFMLNKLIKDFFQYSRNSFDSMAQAANSGCLARKRLKIERVDFPAIHKELENKYSIIFPEMTEWFKTTKNDNNYMYIDDFCNRTKHTHDVYSTISMSFSEDKDTITIDSFQKKNVLHEKKDVKQQLNLIYNFIIDRFNQFIKSLEIEIEKKTFISDRYTQLFAFQQHIKDDPESDYSVAFIKEETDFSTMSDEIEILLLAKYKDGTISSHNCTIDTIYVQSKENEREYVGKYISQLDYILDSLVFYRKYNKVIHDDSQIPLSIEIIRDPKNKKHFYHNNPFIKITTISDDDEFLKRVQLPF